MIADIRRQCMNTLEEKSLKLNLQAQRSHDIDKFSATSTSGQGSHETGASLKTL